MDGVRSYSRKEAELKEEKGAEEEEEEKAVVPCVDQQTGESARSSGGRPQSRSLGEMKDTRGREEEEGRIINVSQVERRA